MTPAGFCTECGAVIQSFDGLNRCPECKTTGKPCGTEYQVVISINWHELRVLCIWAERWAIEKVEPSGEHGGRGVVYAIADRIAEQHKERAEKMPLTFAGELRQCREAGYDVWTNIPGEEQ